MDIDPKTPNVEVLRQMPYSQLKKIAKERGLKGNLKAEKIIAALTSLDSSDDFESFSTPAQKEMNSSRKNKEDKFNEDMMTPLVTPRRGTYSIGSPISYSEPLKVEDISPESVTHEVSALDMSNVTIGRGSERKLRPRKVSFMSPVITPRTPKNSNLRLRPKTPIASNSSLRKKVSPASGRRSRGSLRKSVNKSLNSTSNSQSFIYEVDTCEQLSEADAMNNSTTNPQITEDEMPVSKSVPSKNADKSNDELNEANKVNNATTIPQITEEDKTPFSKLVPSDDANKSSKELNEAVAVNDAMPNPQITGDNKTPFSKLLSSKDTKESTSQKSDVSKIARIKRLAIPRSTKSVAVKNEALAESKRKATPRSTKSVVLKSEALAESKRKATPKPTKSVAFKDEVMSGKIKRIGTPGFEVIHEKAFEKMESIDDYQKRIISSAKKMSPKVLKSKVTKAKSKIPGLSGIPFIPSVSGTTRSKMNLSASIITGDKQLKIKCSAENVPKKSKLKFDLKASLSRKLGYKPYAGPLKPLAESNASNTSTTDCYHNVKQPLNKVVSSNRVQSRAVLKGVRTNKRFELQMKNRKLD